MKSKYDYKSKKTEYKVFAVRLNTRDFDIISRAAKAHNTSMSEFVRVTMREFSKEILTTP